MRAGNIQVYPQSASFLYVLRLAHALAACPAAMKPTYAVERAHVIVHSLVLTVLLPSVHFVTPLQTSRPSIVSLLLP